MTETTYPPKAGDTVQMKFSGPGYDPIFTVVDVYDDGCMIDPVVELSNGATIYSKDFASGRFRVID